MCRGTKNPHKLKVICYAVCLIDLNEYLDDITRESTSEKIC